MPGLCKQPLRRVLAAAPGEPLSSLPAGTVIRIPVAEAQQTRWGRFVDWSIADQGHPGYPEGATTLITRQVIQFLPYDAMEPDNPNAMRAIMGNNRYLHANIHQFLNSAAPAGQWYSSRHPYDTPPSAQYTDGGRNAYDTLPGFLALFPPSFTGSILPTRLSALQCAVDGGGLDQLEAGMFLPCAAEVGADGDPRFASEGTPFAIFTDDQSRLAGPTAAAVAHCDSSDTSIAVDQPTYYSLRTPFLDDLMPGCIYSVLSDGTLGEYSGAVYAERAIRPACNLPGSQTVAWAEEEGCYTLA